MCRYKDYGCGVYIYIYFDAELYLGSSGESYEYFMRANAIYTCSSRIGKVFEKLPYFNGFQLSANRFKVSYTCNFIKISFPPHV